MKNLPILMARKLFEDVEPIALHGDGGAQALARVAPDHGRIVEGQDQPHDAHQHDEGESDVHGDGSISSPLTLFSSLP